MEELEFKEKFAGNLHANKGSSFYKNQSHIE
jgi:hypothetical protein